jgi:uncharacterized protein YdaU (DUF1376 family)
MIRPWMPLYIGDYLADTGHLTAQEHGAYLLLLMHQWNHGSIPNNPEILTRIARVHPPHWPRTWKVLSQFFHDQEGGVLIQKRLAAEISKAAEISNKRKQAALQMHSKSSANAEQVHTQPQSQAQSTEEESKKERKKESARATRGTRLSEDWKLSDHDRLVATEEGLSELDIAREAKIFRDYWISVAGSKGVHLDWSATWRNWVRRTADRRGIAPIARSEMPSGLTPEQIEDWKGGWRPGMPSSAEMRAKHAERTELGKDAPMVEDSTGPREEKSELVHPKKGNGTAQRMGDVLYQTGMVPRILEAISERKGSDRPLRVANLDAGDSKDPTD